MNKAKIIDRLKKLRSEAFEKITYEDSYVFLMEGVDEIIGDFEDE